MTEALISILMLAGIMFIGCVITLFAIALVIKKGLE